MEDQHEDALKVQIRAFFARVKAEHKRQVLETIKNLSNYDKLSYLRGWVNVK